MTPRQNKNTCTRCLLPHFPTQSELFTPPPQHPSQASCIVSDWKELRPLAGSPSLKRLSLKLDQAGGSGSADGTEIHK